MDGWEGRGGRRQACEGSLCVRTWSGPGFKRSVKEGVSEEMWDFRLAGGRRWSGDVWRQNVFHAVEAVLER